MNFKESLKKLRNMSDDEVVTMVEKATGKELVSYEGIDALVAALMGFYNGELKKKSSTGHKHTKEEITDFTHNHDDRYNTKNEINDKLNTKLDKGGLPTKITNAKSLYDLIENNSGLNFDPNLLFLNDAGTKTQGKIYFDKNKKGMFKCIKQTTGVVNSTEFFVDISNNASSDKLENLRIKLVAELYNYKPTTTILQQGTILFNNSDIERILTQNKVDFMCIGYASNGLSIYSSLYIPGRRFMVQNTQTSVKPLQYNLLTTMEDDENNICVYGQFDASNVNEFKLAFYSINA